MRNVHRLVTGPLYKILSLPSFRYSYFFDVFAHTARENMMKIAMEFATHSKVEGDYLEFGVNKGESFVMAFHFGDLGGLRSL